MSAHSTNAGRVDESAFGAGGESSTEADDAPVRPSGAEDGSL